MSYRWIEAVPAEADPGQPHCGEQRRERHQARPRQITYEGGGELEHDQDVGEVEEQLQVARRRLLSGAQCRWPDQRLRLDLGGHNAGQDSRRAAKGIASTLLISGYLSVVMGQHSRWEPTPPSGDRRPFGCRELGHVMRQ